MLVSAVFVLVNLAILALNLKLYTEFYKESAQRNRGRKPAAASDLWEGHCANCGKAIHEADERTEMCLSPYYHTHTGSPVCADGINRADRYPNFPRSIKNESATS